jgi:hypothetical protein
MPNPPSNEKHETALERIESALITQAAKLDDIAIGLGLIGAPPPVPDAVLRRFDEPDEVRTFDKGKFEVIRIGRHAIGRATYAPGWKWSVDVGAKIGQTHCTVEHLGYVLSGAATAAFVDGRVYELRAGTMFYISPEPHDSWVLGDEPYVSLHLMGAGHYAKK